MNSKQSIAKVKLSVVVCTFNRAESLRNCLESLVKCGYPAMEVVVVDGGSTDGTREVVREVRKKLKIRWVEERRRNLALARDRGWREAKGKYVAWIDDDVVVSRKWAREVVRVLDQDAKMGGVSGPTVIPEDRLKDRAAFFWVNSDSLGARFWVWFMLMGRPEMVGRLWWHGWWSPGANFIGSTKLKGLIEVNYLEACNMILRRELVEKVGGFDKGFAGTSEWCEVDLALRVKRLGYRLMFDPKARVEHWVSRSGAYERRRRWSERGRNYVKYLWKRGWRW